MARLVGTYHVRALNQDSVIATVRTTSSEMARELARPHLEREGVDPSDPLVVQQIAGRTWEPEE